MTVTNRICVDWVRQLMYIICPVYVNEPFSPVITNLFRSVFRVSCVYLFVWIRWECVFPVVMFCACIIFFFVIKMTCVLNNKSQEAIAFSFLCLNWRFNVIECYTTHFLFTTAGKIGNNKNQIWNIKTNVFSSFSSYIFTSS